ncbi:MAG: hypothetical protein JRI56_12855 [Deltaproteobacteria bacterium]|nr:hypothetical protein [Deltaproteobacteria bacterium]
MSIRRQCKIISFNRSSLYYGRIGLSEEEQRILEEMDKIYMDFPIYGSRRMSRELRRRGFKGGLSSDANGCGMIKDIHLKKDLVHRLNEYLKFHSQFLHVMARSEAT